MDTTWSPCTGNGSFSVTGALPVLNANTIGPTYTRRHDCDKSSCPHVPSFQSPDVKFHTCPSLTTFLP